MFENFDKFCNQNPYLRDYKDLISATSQEEFLNQIKHNLGEETKSTKQILNVLLQNGILLEYARFANAINNLYKTKMKFNKARNSFIEIITNVI